MRMILALILLIFGIYLITQAIYSIYYFRIATKLSQTTYARRTQLGNNTKPPLKVFIDGDSVGAGVGATSFETSLAGRIGNFLSENYFVEFENKSVSGKKMADVLSDVPANFQDVTVLVISSNNLFRFTELGQFTNDTKKVFELFAPKTKKLILIGPGRVADSNAIPLIMKPLYRHQGKKYAEIISTEAKKYQNIAHVNPQSGESSEKKYGYTLSSDKFHPNDSGHTYWFDLLKNELPQ